MGKIMQQFYAEVKRKDGTDYEPSSLANMQAAIDRGLKEAGYMYSLLTSRHFLNSRNVLEGEARLLREQEKSKVPTKSTKDSLMELFPRGSLKPGNVDFMKHIEFKYQKCLKPEMIVSQRKFSELI